VKKVIPQKVANKVYSKLLPENQNRVEGDWVEEVLFKSGTNRLSNKFFKNPFRFIYSRKRTGRYLEWTKLRGLFISKRQNEKVISEINDYLQER
jgi:hypothetical protein